MIAELKYYDQVALECRNEGVTVCTYAQWLYIGAAHSVGLAVSTVVANLVRESEISSRKHLYAAGKGAS